MASFSDMAAALMENLNNTGKYITLTTCLFCVQVSNQHLALHNNRSNGLGSNQIARKIQRYALSAILKER